MEIGFKARVVALLTLQALVTPAAAAERPDTITRAFAYVAPACPVTPDVAIQKEVDEGRLEFLGPVIGMIVAGIAGELAKTGVTAAGDALEQASREQGFGVEAATWYQSATLRKREGSGQLARITRNPACLVLFTQDSGSADIAGFPAAAASDPVIAAALATISSAALIATDNEEGREALDLLKERGGTRMPGLYLEARILSGKEGIVIRPVLVRYAKALPGAPQASNASELHVTLATPGATDLGTAFATVRLKLPKIAPGQTLAWDALRSSASPMMAARPTAGAIDNALTNANGAYTALATRNRELVVANRALLVAEIRLRAKPQDADLLAVKTAADNAVEDAKTAVAVADTAANTVEDTAVGATNVSARFVVIRAENKFGMALAKALKGQAEAAGKAASGAIAPSPEFTANDTAYIAAEATLAAKQREYDTAVTAGDAAIIAKLLGELNVAKAKVNEAAVAIKRPIPYPGLL